MKGRLAFLLLTCATALGSTAAGAVALSMSQLPPDLQRLLAAEQHLPATQVVVTDTVSPQSGGRTRSSVLRARSTPAQTSETITNGGQTADVVQIGRLTYVSATGLARIDGGRRWIRTEDGPIPPRFVADVVDLEGVDLLGLCKAVTEQGPGTVGATPVTQFLATGCGQGLLGIPLGKQRPTTDQVSFAANGLLVQATINGSVTVTTSITTPVPLVSRPPASQTVARSRLTGTVRRRADRLVNAIAG